MKGVEMFYAFCCLVKKSTKGILWNVAPSWQRQFEIKRGPQNILTKKPFTTAYEMLYVLEGFKREKCFSIKPSLSFFIMHFKLEHVVPLWLFLPFCFDL